jgi:hypothetical protein
MDNFIPCNLQELLLQIGIPNLLAISGGRVQKRETGVTLPVGSGYSVSIDLAPSDTYTVRRLFTRAGKTTIKGEWEGVYFENVGELAYRASCFRSYTPEQV